MLFARFSTATWNGSFAEKSAGWTVFLAVRRARNRGHHLAELRPADPDDLDGDLNILEVRAVLQQCPVQAGGGLAPVDDLQAPQFAEWRDHLLLFVSDQMPSTVVTSPLL